MNPHDPLTWTPIGRKRVFSTRVFDVVEIESRSPEGDDGRFLSLEAADWAIIVPTVRAPDGSERFLMVRQWRHGSESLSVEFPGGVIEPGEDPLAAARRELREETGREARTIELAATLSPNPAIMSNRCHIFLAELGELGAGEGELALDEDEYLVASTIPVDEVFAMMGRGEFTHALMVAALFLYAQKKGLLRG
ncbi:MAG TPA: NUDIX hydrolase [Treponemataceae bacterium]|nr:NUDIX hydrolase [Treponemataceae bacterium]